MADKWREGLPYRGSDDAGDATYWREGLPFGDYEAGTTTLSGASGIASGEAFGGGVVAGPIVGATGIPSEEAFGLPDTDGGGTVWYPVMVGETGIPSAEAFGAGFVVWDQTLVGSAGIASAETVGSTGVVAGPITGSTGITSEEAFGAGTVIPSPATLTGTSGIASAEAFGAGSVHMGIAGGYGIAVGDPVYHGGDAGHDEHSWFGRGAVIGTRAFTLFIGGIDRTTYMRANGATINRRLGSPDTATFMLFERIGAYRPLPGQEVLYYKGSTRKFAGHIMGVNEEWKRTAQFVSLDCTDYTGILDRRIVCYDYSSTPELSTVVTHVVNTFLDGENITLAACASATLSADQLQFSDITVREVLDQLCDMTGYSWRIDYFRNLYVEAYPYTDAPWTINAYNDKWREVRVNRTARQVRTMQGVRTVIPTVGTRSETQHGVLGQWWYPVLYPIAANSVPQIQVNNLALETVVLDTQRGQLDHDWYFTPGNKIVYRNTEKAALNNGDLIVITYVPVSSDVVWESDQDAIDAWAHRTGTSGVSQVVQEGAELVSEDAASDVAGNVLDRFSGAQIAASFQTDVDGLEPGQILPVDSEDYPQLMGQLLIDSVSLTEMDKSFIRYSVTGAMTEPLAIVSVSNTIPVQVTTEYPHELVDNQTVTIYGVEGTTNANVRGWRVKVISATVFELPGVAGNGTHVAYTGWVLVGFSPNYRTIVSMTDGATPTIEVDSDHGFTVPADPTSEIVNYHPSTSTYLPKVSINGVTVDAVSSVASAWVNGQNKIFIPLTSTTGIIGPPGPIHRTAYILQHIGAGSSDVEVETSEAHNLITGQAITIDNTGESEIDNHAHIVTVVGPTTLTLNNTDTLVTSGSSGTMALVPDHIEITSISGSGGAVTVTTDTYHGLTTNQRVTIEEAYGWADICGTYFVTVTGLDTFTLQDTTGTGTATGGIMQSWPYEPLAYIDGGAIVANMVPPPIKISIMLDDEITTDGPHGIDADDTVVTLTGPNGVDANVVATSTGTETFTVYPVPTRRGGATVRPGSTGRINGRGGQPSRRTTPQEQVSRVVSRTRGARSRALDRAVFVLASSIPGYSASPLVTGTNVTNPYTVVRTSRVMAVIACFRTPPLGSSLIFDINADGTSVFDATRGVYAEGEILPQRYINFASRGLLLAAGTQLTVDIDQVGSTFGGCDGQITVILAPVASI